MPRDGQRFSFLERALRLNGGTASGGVLAEYLAFKAGTNKPNRRASALPTGSLKRVLYGALPFGTADAIAYTVALSKNSNDWRKNNELSNTNLGLATVTADTKTLDNYYPALVKIRISTGPPQTGANSGITKREYTYIPSRTYSIPFGRGASGAAATEFGQQQAIKTAAAGIANKLGVTFVPEELGAAGQGSINGD